MKEKERNKKKERNERKVQEKKKKKNKCPFIFVKPRNHRQAKFC